MMRRPGSSLLMVVLVMTAVATLAVAGARALFLSSRQSASYDASERARQIARAGIEEATARLANVSGLGAYGEFGNASGAAVYPLVPVRRALAASSDGVCTRLGPVAPTARPECPYYDISIRTVVAVDPLDKAPQLAKFNHQAFRAEDFRNGTEVLVPVVDGETFSFTTDINASVTYRTCSDYAGLTCSAPVGPIAGVFSIINASAVKSARMTFNYSATLDGHVAKLSDCSALSGRRCAMGKGYVTAEVVGYSGTAQAHYIIEKHPYAAASTPFVRETAHYFNNYGILKP